MNRSLEYFTIEELCHSDTAARLNIPNVPSDEIVRNLRNLVIFVLDPLRRKYGKPIYINSGYRCPDLNRAVGGVRNSQHLTGMAADITAGSKRENKRLFDLIRQTGMFDQLIDESNFTWVHVSFNIERNRKEALKL